MEERIFNFFIYFEDGTAREIGVRFHKHSGTSVEKTDFLRSQIEIDHPKARRFDLPHSFTPEQWRARLRIDGAMPIFEPILANLNAPKRSFIYCLTPVLDGTPHFDRTADAGPLRDSDEYMPDYLVEYTDGQHFRIDQLLNDDFFSAIRILFQSKHYVSASKLLMCCIDTLAFVEFGDTRRNFSKWLEEYCDLSPLGINEDELWEYRNAVLHMTSLDSKKVIAGKVERIIPYVATPGSPPPQSYESAKPFNLRDLIDIIANGINHWAASYNASPSKLTDFISRYDEIISDKRVRITRST